MNQSGIKWSRIKHVVYAKCESKECSHTNSHEVLRWALPLAKKEDPRVPVIETECLAWSINFAMLQSNSEALALVLPRTLNLNISEITHWYSASHHLADKILRSKDDWGDEALQLFIKHGLDLHVDSERVFGLVQFKANDSGGNTMTSMVMQTSAAFIKFRRALRGVGIDIPTFIQEELKQEPLTKAGWTQYSLKSLFDIDYVPLEMPQTCSKHVYYVFSLAHEKSWTNMLERLRLREGSESESSTEEILEIRDREIKEFGEPLKGRCWECEEGMEDESSEDELGEKDSHFLLSI